MGMGGAPMAQGGMQMVPMGGGGNAGPHAGPLECLRNVPGLWIFQVFKAMELIGFEASNSYNLFSKTGPGIRRTNL